MDKSTVLFPRLNITYGDLLKHKGKKFTTIAKALGTTDSRLSVVMSEHNLHKMFAVEFFYKRKDITKSEAMELKGEKAEDAPGHLNITMKAFRDCCYRHKMCHLFKWQTDAKNGKKPIEKKENKSVGYGPDLIKEAVDCMNPSCDETVNIKYFPGLKVDRRRFCPRCKGRSNYYEEESQLPRC